MINKLDSNLYLYESNIQKINFYNCFKSKSGKYGLKTKFVGTEGQIGFWYLIAIDGKLTDVYDWSGEFDFVSRPVRKSHPSNIRIGLLRENGVFSDGIPDSTKLSKVVIVVLVDNEHEFY